MDGVVANCTGAIANHLGIKYPKGMVMHNPREIYEKDFGYDKVFEIFTKEKFWIDIPKYSWSDKIVSFFEEKFGDDWIFLTKGFEHPNCWSGKYKWMEKNYPQHIDKLWVCGGRRKDQACGGEGDFLADDSDHNIDPWIGAGGIAYKWIEMTETTDDKIVNERLKNMDKLLSPGLVAR